MSKATIRVRNSGDGDPLVFKTELDGTPYDVTVARHDLERLGGGRPGEDLVAAAFRFLLDREPKEAILRRFDLSVISRYFPDFEQELPGYLGRDGVDE